MFDEEGGLVSDDKGEVSVTLDEIYEIDVNSEIYIVILPIQDQTTTSFRFTYVFLPIIEIPADLELYNSPFKHF